MQRTYLDKDKKEKDGGISNVYLHLRLECTWKKIPDFQAKQLILYNVQFPLRDPVVDLRWNPSDRYDGFHHCAMMYYVREHSLFVFPSEVKEYCTSSRREKQFL